MYKKRKEKNIALECISKISQIIIISPPQTKHADVASYINFLLVVRLYFQIKCLLTSKVNELTLKESVFLN